MLLENIVPTELINGLICVHPSNLTDDNEMKDFNDVHKYFSSFYLDKECLTIGTEKSCKNSSYFYCNKSMKCISYNRVGDGMVDCYYLEDESFDACQLNDSNRFKCPLDSSRCLLPVTVGNGFLDCDSGEDELFIYSRNFATLVLFPDLCNAKENDNLTGVFTNTDETTCNWWPCDNPYTHCDQNWNCLNGADELNCPHTKCSFNEHECENKQLELSYSIPSAQIYERYLHPCNSNPYLFRDLYFYNETYNISQNYFSWNNSECITLEKLCRINQHLQTSLVKEDVCFYTSDLFLIFDTSLVKLFQTNESLCDLKLRPTSTTLDGYFLIATQLGYLPAISMNLSIRIISKTNQKKMNIKNIDTELVLYCHRGILLLTGSNRT